jgi:hypothetical protein
MIPDIDIYPREKTACAEGCADRQGYSGRGDRVRAATFSAATDWPNMPNPLDLRETSRG